MEPAHFAIFGLTAVVSFLLGAWVCGLGWKKTWREMMDLQEQRKQALIDNATSERQMLQKAIDQERAAAATERRELYSRIQAYDPNVGEYTPPSLVAPPSRPGEEVQTERSYTAEELGQMGLVLQTDGMIRDSRNDALFETVEDWRFWNSDMKKRNLPQNVHPEVVREYGWEHAVAYAKQQTAAKNGTAAKK